MDNIRIGWKGLPWINILAYYKHSLVTNVKVLQHSAQLNVGWHKSRMKWFIKTTKFSIKCQLFFLFLPIKNKTDILNLAIVISIVVERSHRHPKVEGSYPAAYKRKIDRKIDR